MKKLLIISLFIPLVSFGQTANEFAKGGHEKFKLKDYYGAISDYTKAIEIYPNTDYAYANRGAMKAILKNLKGACVDWKKAAELGNKDAADWLAQDCK